MVSAKRLSGINPLAYVGVEPNTPAPLFVKDRSPTVNDYQNFNIGTFWLVSGHSVSEEIWMLVALEAGIATWVQLYPGGGGGGANTFPADVGVANEAGGVLNILGDGNVTTTGAGNTITISLAGTFSEQFNTDAGTATPAAGVIIIHGGTNIGTTGAGNTVTINLDPSISLAGSLSVGTTSLFIGNAEFDAGVRVTSFGRGVVQSDASGILSSTNGTDGQVIIAATGADPAWANLTSLDSSITITNGPNSIDLSAVGGGGGGAINFPTDSGTATEAAGVLRILGGTNIGTTGAGNTVTVNLDPSVTLAGSLVVGTTLNVGGASQFTGNALFNGNVTVNNFSEGVVQSDNSGLLFSDKGNNGQVLIGSTGGAPLWRNLTAGSNVNIINGANSITIEATGGGGGGGTSCAFLAHQAATASFLGTTYDLGSAVVLTEDFDVGGNFFPGDGVGGPATFTAPVTGKYFLQFTADWNNQPSRSTTLFGDVLIVTPSKTYRGSSVSFSGSSPNSTNITASTTVCADLNIGDVVTFEVNIFSGPGGRVLGNTTPLTTYCSGFLVQAAGVIPASFMAYQAVDQAGLFLASPDYTLGTLQALVVPTDTGGDFYAGSGAGLPAVFTAPATGVYSFQLTTAIRNNDSTTIFAANKIVTPAFTFYSQPVDGLTGTVNQLLTPVCTATTTLNGGDQVTFVASYTTTSGGPLGVTVLGSASPLITWASGFRVS